MTSTCILVVTHYYPLHGGGVERVAGYLTQLFTERGFEILWFASDCDPAPRDAAGFMCMPARACNVIERRFGIPYPLWDPRAFFRLWRETRRVSLVHIHDFIYFGNLAAYLFAAVLRKPVLVTQHIGFVPYRSRVLRGLLSILNRTLGTWALGRADQVVFVSHTVRDYFARFVRFRRSPLVIANGVDATLFKPADAKRRANLRAELRVEADQPLLLFVGRFVEKKGLPILRELAGRFPHCNWIFAGQGPLDPAVWRLPNVRILRNVPQEDLVPYYQSADLLVLPSKGEGFPLVVQEAMACGTPALVGPDSANAQPIKPGLIFYADVDGQDPSSIWQVRLKELLADRQALADVRGDVADFAHRTWSWEACAEAYADIIKQLVTQEGNTLGEPH